MKRSAPPQRKTGLKRSTKPIPKLNLRKAKRKRDRYAAYLRSPEWKEKKRLVRERSGGRCEYETLYRVFDPPHSRNPRDELYTDHVRCTERATVCNHKTYARFGHELLEDLEHLCQAHNAEYENARGHRAERRRAIQQASGVGQ